MIVVNCFRNTLVLFGRCMKRFASAEDMNARYNYKVMLFFIWSCVGVAGWYNRWTVYHSYIC